MDPKYDTASSSVENQCSDNGEQLRKDESLAMPEQIYYQQQHLMNPLPQMETSTNDRTMEIPAAKVRSSLAELELQASQSLQHLEAVKINTDTHTASAPVSSASSTTGLLANDRYSPADVLNFLESVIVTHAKDSQEPDDNQLADSEYLLPSLNEVSHLALVSHSIIAYLSHSDTSKLSRITAKLAGDTNRWLAHLFRFIDADASYHYHSVEAIVRALRLAAALRCPKGEIEDLWLRFNNPCLYICENSCQIGIKHACRTYAIPLSCIRLVPATAFGTMDISELQKLIANDVAMKRIPLFVISDVGESLCGQVDNIQRLQDVCKTYTIWLHCRGHNLAALAITQGTIEQSDGRLMSPVADSMSLDLGSWLALPNLPVVLLHRHVESPALKAADMDPVASRRLNSLLLWTSLQAFGRDQIAGLISFAFDCCRMIYEIVSKCQGLRVLSKAPAGGSRSVITDLIYKPLNVPLLFEYLVPVVVFQFDGHLQDILPQQSSSPAQTADVNNVIKQTTNKNDDPQTETSVSAIENNGTNNELTTSIKATESSIITKSIEKVANSTYFNNLNSWLGSNLQRDCPGISLKLHEHPIHGTCIRFCPFEMGLGEECPSFEQLEILEECLENQIDILRATVKHKATLNRLVGQSNVLRLVPLHDWAGLGGVRFVPENWEIWLGDQAQKELNRLNADLVNALRATDNAFSLGDGTDGFNCIRFGMVTEETDVEELLDMVISFGRGVQKNSRVLDTMSEIVKKGIETATADLQRESDEKLWSEGILRQVPVVGSVVNWWSPLVKETGIKGRSLNLTQGTVESTENIYRYHMQLTNDGQPQIQGTTKMTPQPMVKTSVSSGHSRQSSATSTTIHDDQSTVQNTEILAPTIKQAPIQQ